MLGKEGSKEQKTKEELRTVDSPSSTNSYTHGHGQAAERGLPQVCSQPKHRRAAPKIGNTALEAGRAPWQHEP